MLKIIIGDDHPVWLVGVTSELSSDFEILATAKNATETIKFANELTPDVIVSDLNMEGGGGIAVAKSCSSHIPVLILTSSDHEKDLKDAITAGALGYILKTATKDAMVGAINDVAKGIPSITPELAAFVLSEFRKLSEQNDVKEKGELSAREQEVLRAIAKGYSYREIGEQLFISAKTVENHTRNIMSKLHIRGREQLVNYVNESQSE
jgi:DNA-binding NarL/FixJ family response regulator